MKSIEAIKLEARITDRILTTLDGWFDREQDSRELHDVVEAMSMRVVEDVKGYAASGVSA